MSNYQQNMRLVPRVFFGAGCFVTRIFMLFTVGSVVVNVCSQLVPVNVAMNKPITAEITCGNPAETFTAHIESSKSPQDRITSTCDASNSSLAHPPENMVDNDPSTGEVYTWWQSTSRTRLILAGYTFPESLITLDLQEVHAVVSISIQMGDSVRPGQVGIEKSQDGITFLPWLYQVSELSECTSVFGRSRTTSVTSLDTVLCTTFLSSEQPRNEVITFTLSPPADLLSWQQARYIRINFYNMPRSFGFFSDEFHHYTVRNLQVMAQCSCNGHATSCTQQPLTSDPTRMTYQCGCGDNTQGDTCGECLPFYNQLAYQPGDNGFVCEACNCFTHSDVCVFDEAVARVNGSLNSQGIYQGGGVCQDCRNFTAGTNCHQCLQFYFRPIDQVQSNESACQPCGCNLPGTREDANTGLVRGECVMNNDAPNPAGMQPGDCYCKVNVQGSKCNECRDGFYQLTDANTNGCLGCDCFTDGTVSGSNICAKDSIGQCPCKTYVTGRRCDECQDGYYGLLGSRAAGCQNCGCDVGGAQNNVCNKTTGNCMCRTGVTGQQCESVAEEFYYPTLHSISAEFESIDNPYWKKSISNFMYIGYVDLSGVVNTSTILTVPPSQFSGQFHLILRAITQGSSNVAITITPMGDNSQAGVQRGVAPLPTCASWCYDGVVQNSDPLQQDRFLLQPGSYMVTAGINTQAGARVLLDQIVALPVEYVNTRSLLGQARATEYSASCFPQSNDMRIGTSDESFCLSNVFSLTTFYFEGALACACDPVGSTGSSCARYGGQCPCQGGVGGRTCDACLPEFFSFRSSGCAECDCFGDEKVCDVVTGQCSCPPNTAGRRCDRCVTFTWGLNSTTGCKACGCNPVGSVSLQCDQETGQCVCQPGVGGRDCSQCLPGFKELSTDGCAPCDCDPEGSVSTVCDPVSGQCTCKGNTQGLFCDTCMAGTFYINEAHPQGCLDCVCMGITDQCDSTTQRSIQYSVPTSSGAQGLWEVVITPSAGSTPSPVTITTSVVDGTEFVTAILESAGTQAQWRLPAPDFAGNLLGMYGQSLTFDLVYFIDAASTGAVAGQASVLIEGLTEGLRYVIGILEPSSISPVTIDMDERSSWLSLTTGQPVSRQQFLTILADVSSIQVTASLTSVAHNSSIGRVLYQRATSSQSSFYDQSAPRALAVEQCICGPEYSGLSCEECAEGHRRVNAISHAFFGECIPCECNGHSSTCDPNTGQCLECQDNTGGFNCELCLDGYYGNATLGTADACQECPCGPPTARTNVCAAVSGMVMCLDCLPGHIGPLCNVCENFYYGRPSTTGGFCRQCNCNGNTDICDSVTGECMGCRFSTTGVNCERCQDFFFGNASLQDCQACDCDLTGSTGLLCNNTSGQCPCLPGIGGRQCDSCLPNYFGFGDAAGCTECGCNEFGSVSMQCDQSGVCTCLAGVQGEKCDICEDGSYGLPTRSCMACGCDSVGTVGGAQAICNPVSGQCPCKTGVTARVCDRCLPGFVNFSSEGCTKCDQCVDTLYNSTNGLEVLQAQLMTLGAWVQSLQDFDTQLHSLDPEVTAVSTDLETLSEELSRLRSDVEGIDTAAFQRNVTLLADMASTLADTMAALRLQSSMQLDQINVYREAATQTLNGVLSANNTVQGYVATLTLRNDSATILVADAMVRRDSVAALSVAGQREVIETELGRTRNVSLEVDSLLLMVMAQGRELNRLIELISSAESQLQETRRMVVMTHDALDLVQTTLDETDNVLNFTQTNQAYSNRLLSEAQGTLDVVAITMEQSRQAILDADQALVDANTIYLGSTLGSQAIPVPASVDQMDINGWVRGNLRVTSQMGEVQNAQGELEVTVSSAEIWAAFLTGWAQQSLSIFQSAKPVGQSAVVTVDNYRDVVTTVGVAMETVQNATDSLSSTQAYLAGRSVATLSEEAQRSAQASADLKNMIEGSVTDTQGLTDALDSANQTLQSAITSWEGVRQEVTNLESEVNSLTTLAADPGITPAVQSGTVVANDTVKVGNAILQDAATLDGRLDQDEIDIVFVQESINNASVLMTDIPGKVTKAETDVETLSTNVNAMLSLQNTTSILRSGITDKIARLREKLRLAQDTIADSEQPVHLSGQSYLAVVEPVSELALYNEIQLDVRPGQRDGLVFFTENLSRNLFLSIEIIASSVFFRYRLSQDIVSVSSPIDVCCGDWYRVLATRYGDGGELTVTLLSTGGSSTSSARSYSVYNTFMHFQPNTTFYIGGIPDNYQTDSVLSRDFDGCIADVSFDGQRLDLWRPNEQQGSASCCTPPVTPVEPEVARVPGVSFDGFGYYQVLKEDFDVFEQARISLEFRTVLKEGVLFSVTRPDLISYIGIYVMDSRVIFEMNTAGNARYSVGSIGSYDDGQWYQVTASFNSSHYSLEIRYANDSSSLIESSTRCTLAPLSFPNLQFSPKITLGGADPDHPSTSVRGPTNLGFAGNIRYFALSNSSSLELGAREISNTSLLQYRGVSFSGYPEEVVPGVGFSGEFAHVAMMFPGSSVTMETIHLRFKTTEPHGILVYSYDSTLFNKLLYIALVHGNIFVQFNLGNGISDPLQTRGLKLNTGQWQELTLSLNGLTASLRVNNLPVIYGASQLSTSGVSINGLSFLGGVVPTIPVLIGGAFPIRQSLNGDIADFTINDVSPNLNDPSIVVSSLGIILTGVNPPVSILPPLPYVTEPPPTGAGPLGSCADPVSVFLYPESLDVIRFGVTRRSYLAVPLDKRQQQSLSQTYVLAFQFRSLSPNGVMLYFANNYDNPTQFLALVMSDGFLNLFILDQSRMFMQATTSLRYNDAKWRTLTMLKINGFVALLVDETDDYVRVDNENGLTDATSILDIRTDLFVGGLGPQVLEGSYPLNAESDDSFNGCIRSMTVSTEFESDIPISLSATSSNSMNVTSCRQNPIGLGGYFDGTGWLLLESNYSMVDAWSVSMTISTTSRDALLVAIAADDPNFLVLDLADGAARAVIGFGSSPSTIIRSSQMASGYDICDGQLHTIRLTITGTGLIELTVDENPADSLIVDQQSTLNISGRPLYIGGISGLDAVPLIPGILTTPFMGCIESLTMDNIAYDLHDHVLSSGFTVGCPLPLP